MFNRRKPEPPTGASPPPAKPAQADFLSAPASAPAPTQVPAAANELAIPSPATYQTAPLKEIPMARSPFAPPLQSNPSPLRPAVPGQPAQPAYEPEAEAPSRRTLVVGRGISVQGTVQDAERLVVEGTMEATVINGLAELFIPLGGIFKGEVEVDNAEVAGTVDGTLTARNALIVRGTGRVLGIARCRRLQVEDGGQITGRIEMITAAPPAGFAPASQQAETLEA